MGKKSSETCEDGIVVTDNFVAVIDGSTSKTPFQLLPTAKNGRYAMTLITRYIQAMPAQTSAEEFCQGVTALFLSIYDSNDIAERMSQHPEERLCASAIVYSHARKEIWMVGDCQAIIDGTLYENPKPYEDMIARHRVAFIRQGIMPQEARKRIEPLLVKAMKEGQNKTYAVIDGFPIYQQGIKIISLPSHAHEVVLASDGYPFLHSSLQESETALAQQLAEDAQNISTFIATKGLVEGNVSFDDRAYIRFCP